MTFEDFIFTVTQSKWITNAWNNKSPDEKNLIIGIIASLVAAVIVLFIEKIYTFFSENWIATIVAFLSIVSLIFIFIIKKIYKCTEKASKIFVIIVMLSIILILGTIAIIKYIPSNPPEYIVVPDLTGMEIVPASYEAFYAGLELNPIKVDGDKIVFQDPIKGSSVMKNSSIKVVIGKPTLEISTPTDNTIVNSSDCYITGNSFGVASNPNLKIYIVISNFSIFQVKKVPPPHFTGAWYGKCSFDNLQGEKFLIYAIITIHDIQNEYNGCFFAFFN